jgi:voltage-gated sodium channel
MQVIFKRLESNKIFQTLIISVIILSALLVGAATHDLPVEVIWFVGIMDVAITAFFLIEIVVRYFATNSAKTFFSKGWNVFDTAVVLGSLVPAGGSSILIARLLRVFRVLRLISMVPELRILINALFKAIPRMGYIVLLMFVIFYIYAAVGSMLFETINPTLWGDVTISMLTLFRVATFEDWTDVMYETMNIHPLSWIYYLSFIFLTAFVFLNMMVGTVLDVMTQEHAAYRKEHSDEEEIIPASQQQVAELKQEIQELKDLIKAKG